MLPGKLKSGNLWYNWFLKLLIFFPNTRLFSSSHLNQSFTFWEPDVETKKKGKKKRAIRCLFFDNHLATTSPIICLQLPQPSKIQQPNCWKIITKRLHSMNKKEINILSQFPFPYSTLHMKNRLHCFQYMSKIMKKHVWLGNLKCEDR